MIEANLEETERESIKKQLMSMNDKRLKRFLDMAHAEYNDRMREKVEELETGDAIKKSFPDGCIIYYLILDIYEEGFYELKIDYAQYYVDKKGTVIFRSVITCDYRDCYKDFGLDAPNTEVIHTNYENCEYEEALGKMMLGIFNKAFGKE